MNTISVDVCGTVELRLHYSKADRAAMASRLEMLLKISFLLICTLFQLNQASHSNYNFTAPCVSPEHLFLHNSLFRYGLHPYYLLRTSADLCV